jgi:hypothetical protein
MEAHLHTVVFFHGLRPSKGGGGGAEAVHSTELVAPDVAGAVSLGGRQRTVDSLHTRYHLT